MKTKKKPEAQASFEDQLRAAQGLPPLPTKEQAAEAKRSAEAPHPDVTKSKRKLAAPSEIDESPFNTRKDFGDLKSLAASIASVGLMQPLVVRPMGNRLELVFGHRRLRAAKVAGLKILPVEVRDLSDVQVREAQLVENLQRKDVNAIEEAQGFRDLMEHHGYTAEQIAAKIGKAKASVYAALKLLSLTPEAKAAVRSNALAPSIGVVLARKDQATQARLLPRLVPKDGPALSLRDAIVLLNSDNRSLRGAPFDQKSEDLVPKAGSCLKCPKRSGSTPGLFDDIAGGETCTDAACFDRKAQASWVLATAKHRAAKNTVISPAASKREFLHDKLHPASQYVALNEPAPRDPKRRTWGQLLSKTKDLEFYVLASPKLKPVVCVRRDAALEALAATVKWAAEAKEEDSIPGTVSDPAHAKAVEDRDARRLVVGNFIDAYLGQVTELELQHWRLLYELAAEDGLPVDEHAAHVLKLPLPVPLDVVLKDATSTEIAMIVFRAFVSSVLGRTHWDGYHVQLTRLAKVIGFDLDQQEAAARASLKRGAKKEPEPTSKTVADAVEALADLGEPMLEPETKTLIADAAEAVETIPADELEAHAASPKKKRLVIDDRTSDVPNEPVVYEPIDQPAPTEDF